MKTIIIHHVQEMWNSGLQKYGKTFESEIEKIYTHLIENNYDRVIVTNFEAGFHLDKEQYILSEFSPEVYDYMYGWERNEVESCNNRKEGLDFCEGGNHSEVVLIDEWMRSLKGEIYLCGAFDGECIEDMGIALNGANKEFNRIEHLIT